MRQCTLIIGFFPQILVIQRGDAFIFLRFYNWSAFRRLCLSRALPGDYDKYQLAQFVSGMALFYVGHYFKTHFGENNH